jgi:hypothetical protein
LFIAEIAAPGLIQTVFELRNGEHPQALDVFLERPTSRNLHAYEARLEQSSLVIKGFRPWMQYAEWSLLADVGEKAVLGRNGWLFYRESVRYLVERPSAGPQTHPVDPLPAILSFRDQLEARGIRLLVVPVPNKESVYPEMLSRRAISASVICCEETRRLLERMDQCGIEYVNLFELFRRTRDTEGQSNQAPLYLAHDTHWTPAGARSAAAAVARQVLATTGIHRGDRTLVERLITLSRHGDLVQMLRAPQIERSLAPALLELHQVIDEHTNAPYHDGPDSEILVLGDSFLRIYEQDEPGAAGFIAHLARELGQPLSSIVNDGGASTLVRQSLARRPTLLAKKKLLIWEFAERDIRYGTEGWQIVPLAREAPRSRQP